MTGDLARGGRAADEGVALLGELAPSILTLAVHGLAANVFLEVGEVDALPRRGGRRRRAGLPRASSPAARPGCWPCSRGPSWRAGDPDAAAAGRARPRAGSPGLALPLTEVAVAHAEALLALERGDWPDAAARAEAARAVARPRRRGVVHAARMRALAGRALAPRGRPRRRRRRCSSAPSASWRSWARSGCAPRRRASCAASASASPRASAAARRGAGLAALSGREREIADLVAEGRTNREIAGELFVSDKTVEGHLRNVFAKLGVSSRAEVAEAVGRARAGRVGRRAAVMARARRDGNGAGRAARRSGPGPRRCACGVGGPKGRRVAPWRRYSTQERNPRAHALRVAPWRVRVRSGSTTLSPPHGSRVRFAPGADEPRDRRARPPPGAATAIRATPSTAT